MPDELIAGADVDVWLPSPGETDERKATPASGTVGDELTEKYLLDAGLTRGQDVSIRHVIRCRWRHPGVVKKVSTLPTGKTIMAAANHCRVHDVDTKAKMAVACGRLPWFELGGPGSEQDWRGFLKP